MWKEYVRPMCCARSFRPLGRGRSTDWPTDHWQERHWSGFMESIYCCMRLDCKMVVPSLAIKQCFKMVFATYGRLKDDEQNKLIRNWWAGVRLYFLLFNQVAFLHSNEALGRLPSTARCLHEARTIQAVSASMTLSDSRSLYDGLCVLVMHWLVNNY